MNAARLERVRDAPDPRVILPGASAVAEDESRLLHSAQCIPAPPARRYSCVNARDAIVRDVESGVLRRGPNGLITLPVRTPYVSAGGNQIVVDEYNGRTFVLFFTLRWFLGDHEGFLFVPEGASPAEYLDLQESCGTATPLAGRWYFVSHSCG